VNFSFAGKTGYINKLKQGVIYDITKRLQRNADADGFPLRSAIGH